MLIEPTWFPSAILVLTEGVGKPGQSINQKRPPDENSPTKKKEMWGTELCEAKENVPVNLQISNT